MLVWLVLAVTIALRPDGPALTPAQARSLSPAALGDALLAPGRPSVVEAAVGPDGMGPPPAPRNPVATEIRLFLPGRPSTYPGFCEKTVATVTLAPVMPRADGGLPAARPSSLFTKPIYRWQGEAASDCEASRHAFFSPASGEAAHVFAVIRLLGRAQRRARRGGVLPFEVSIDDPWARQMREYVRAHPGPDDQLLLDYAAPISDGRTAMAKLPLDAIFGIGSFDAWNEPLSAADLVDEHGRKLEHLTLYAAGIWTAGVVLDGDRIVRVRIRRETPPPF